MTRAAIAALIIGAGAASAHAQVVINEIYCNPVGTGNDVRYEYIELYGTPGMSLSGYAIVCVFGGANTNNNARPGPRPSTFAVGEELPRIQNAWSLDGHTIGANGMFVLYNDLGTSAILPVLPAATNRAGYSACHISPPGAVPAALAVTSIQNNSSQVYMLVRRRPGQTLTGNTSTYTTGATGYAWYKGVNPDVNFDERFDLNGVGTPVVVETPSAIDPTTGTALPPPVPAPRTLEPFQMVDEVGNSNFGGKVLLRNSEHRISDTPGGNPDAFTRVRYFGANPNLGSRFDSNFLATPTRINDESFFYGEIITPTNPDQLRYDQPRSGGPTDPDGLRYSIAGVPDASGAYLFDDLSRVGLHLTPGAFNDVDASTVFDAATGKYGVKTVQFRFIRGDFNFDGFVNADDLALITARVGATLDDTAAYTVPGTPSVTINNMWKWQGEQFQSVLAMRDMDTTDGPGGTTNAPAVTSADLAAFQSLYNSITCPAITTAPRDTARPAGQNVTLNALASGTGPIAYQWFKDGWRLHDGPTGMGSTITGSQTSTLTISGLQSADVGQYAVKASNICNIVTSTPANVSIGTGACTVADVAGLGGIPGADGQLTADDLIYFLSAFFAENVAVADIARLGGGAGSDGSITVDDLIAFLSAFFAGC